MYGRLLRGFQMPIVLTLWLYQQQRLHTRLQLLTREGVQLLQQLELKFLEMKYLCQMLLLLEAMIQKIKHLGFLEMVLPKSLCVFFTNCVKLYMRPIALVKLHRQEWYFWGQRASYRSIYLEATRQTSNEVQFELQRKKYRNFAACRIEICITVHTFLSFYIKKPSSAQVLWLP